MNSPHYKKKWQADRAPYTWYLRPPFSNEFDRAHWWKAINGEPFSALYEIARRHPLVGEAWLKVRHTQWYGLQSQGGQLSGLHFSQAMADLDQEPEAIQCLCLIGSKSWPALRKGDRQLWMSAARKMKGVDCRRDRELCYCLPASDLEIAMWPSDPPKPGLGILRDISRAGVGKRARFPLKPLEAEIVRHALGAHQQGYTLIAIAPDLPAKRAVSLLEKAYRERRVIAGKTDQRARWSDWLPLVESFEEAETKNQNQKRQPFVHYRRVLDSLRFT